MLVPEDFSTGLPEHRAKTQAERAILKSGVPYTIFKPTYFMDTLPRQIQGSRAIVLGTKPVPLHMIAAQDFAKMVSRAFRTPEAANRKLFVAGPEALSIADALRIYCSILEPDKKVMAMPLGVMGIIDRLFMGKKLENTLKLMALITRVGERGNAAETHQLLGKPTTTVRMWCEQERERRAKAKPSGASSVQAHT
jgi:uncharacterized protein YbjT (DUF2867 family)